jgi:hypothetical protein
MNWEAAGAIGEIIGAVAVVGSLAYLAVQIKLNSKLLESAAQNSISVKYSETMSVPAASPENAAVFYKGLTGPEDLTAEQATQFLFMLANTFIQMDYSYQLYLEGHISKERWNQLAQAVTHYINTPGGQFYWKVQGRKVIHLEGSDFSNFVETMIKEYHVVAPPNKSVETDT